MLTTQKSVIQEASVSKRENSFNQKNWQAGEKGISCSETNPEDSAQPWQFLKGKMEVDGENLSGSWRGGGWILHLSPLHTD